MSKPFIKWVGGKSRMLPVLSQYLPQQFGRYYEPFVGGGAFFWHLTTQRPLVADLCDANEELMNCWWVVKTDPHLLSDLLVELSSDISESGYYKIRDWQPVAAIQRAARFIYLNKLGFRGVYRVNKNGGFNVPYGHYKNPQIFDRQHLLNCSAILRHCQIYSGDFSEIKPQAGDFVYLDPPYLKITDTSFCAYTINGFDTLDQFRLSQFVLELHTQGVQVMISNVDRPDIRTLYDPSIFNIQEAIGPRSIAANGKHEAVSELVITNYQPAVFEDAQPCSTF